MSKREFLKRLEQELQVLNKEERQEILRFYEERFYTETKYEHKTEEDVVYELESPEVIAKNVLEEYGVSPKYVKRKEERYSNINAGQVVFILLFDLIVAVWLIPTLFSVAIGIFGSLLSYVGVIPLMIGERSYYDEMTFAFLTGAYILLFIFGLLILDLAIWVTKKIVVWHANVFKLRGRKKLSNRLDRVSVDNFFKRHRKAATIRSILFIGAIVTMLYTGYHLFLGEYNVIDLYENKPVITDEYNEVVADDIANSETWTITTNFDFMDIDVIPVVGDEIRITHKYLEDHDFEIDINDDNNEITMSNDAMMLSLFNAKDWFSFFRQKDSIRLEIPESLLVGDVYIESYNGTISIQDLSIASLDINGLNGQIEVYDLVVTNDVDIATTNGNIIVKNIDSTVNLRAKTTNGSIILDRVSFLEYDLDTTNGEIDLENLNLERYDGFILNAKTTNGKILLYDVYVADVSVESTNGNIEFFNDDQSFDVESFDSDTTNGNTSTNIN